MRTFFTYLLTTHNLLKENNTPTYMHENNLEETIRHIWSLHYPTAVQLGVFHI